MTSRWNRIFAALCAAALLYAPGIAAAADVSPAPTPEALMTADETEWPINAGTLPENIQKLLETAAAEVGYAEGSDGYTKYGAWTGNPTSEWCAEFLCWCVHMTDQLYGYDMLDNVYPYYSGQNTGRDWFVARGRFVYRRGYEPGWGWQWLKDGDGMMQANDYIPRPGDLVFFSYSESGDTAHVAMIEYCAQTADGSVVLHVIEGNNPDRVQRSAYALNNSQILGFGCWGDVVDTTMQYGNTGDKVLKLQQDLGRLGYLSARNYTATYASNTRNAVYRFQQTMNGKTPTGVADRETQLAIAYEIEKLEMEDPNSWLVTDGS